MSGGVGDLARGTCRATARAGRRQLRAVSGGLVAAWLAAVIAAAGATARAQDAEDPEPPSAHYLRLPARGRDAASFAPAGWKVEASASGDVDGDGRADLVLVLHQQDRAFVMAHPHGGESPLDTNPRILAVALAVSDGGYRLACADHALIPRHDDAFVFDLFDPDPSVHAVSVARNAFSVDLRFEANAGSWMLSSRSFTFRVVAGRCTLIGFDEETVDRRDQASVHTSIDYLTRRWLTETAASDDFKPRTRRGVLAPSPLLTLDRIGDGMEFAPKLPTPVASRRRSR